jgi:choline-sulfatase
MDMPSYPGISRREFLKKSAGIAALTALSPTWLFAGQDNPSKNIVFIISDQHRWDVTGCYGNEFISTPNIDRLADEGVRFDNMYCQFPLCVPSRQSIITSQYASIHGVRENVVPTDQDTLIDYLNGEQSYKTMLSGKSHMTTRAFDVCIDWDKEHMLPQYIRERIEKAEEKYWTHYWEMENRITRGGLNTEYIYNPLSESLYEEFLFYRAADRILSSNFNYPILLWISFNIPHPKWAPPGRFLNAYRERELPAPDVATPDIIETLPRYLKQLRIEYGFDSLDQQEITNSVRAYYASVEYMDSIVGLVLELLERYDLVQDTIMVYASDQGEMLGHNGLFFKECFYEPAVHVPCIMRCPGVIPQGHVVGQITELIDIMPTVMDYADIPLRGTEMGSSMRNLIDDPGNPGWKNEAYSEYDDDYVMLRTGDWKYNYYSDDKDQLFHMVDDTDERNNLVDDPQYKDLADELLQRIINKFR